MTALAGMAGPQAVQNGAYNPQDFGYDPNRQVQFGTPTMGPQAQPQTGQLGAESVIRAGLGGAISALDAGQEQGVDALLKSYRGARDQDIGYTNQAIGQSNAGFNGAANALQGFANGGTGAHDLQAALSGALGPIEQERAMANFSNSPGQQYLLDNSERALTRNATATGMGLGGGNILKALQGNAIGLAAQDFGNSFNRLGTVADRGMGAARDISGLNVGRGTTAANLLSGLGARQNQSRIGVGSDIAGLRNNAGVNAANAITGASQFLGGNRMDTGNRIADSINQTTQQVASQQGGETLANLLGGSASQIGNLIVQAQSGDAQAMEALAGLFANMSVGAGGNARQNALPSVQQTDGMIGGISQAAGGIGTLLAMFSDIRLKENIVPVSRFKDHTLYTWDWNEEGKRLTGLDHGFGVIAQEVEKVDPLAVHTKDGYLHVDYGRIING